MAAGNIGVAFYLLGASVIYIVLCFILFHLACHAISRSNDSREGILKGLLALLTILILGMILLPGMLTGGTYSEAALDWMGIVGFFSTLGIGFAFLYNRSDPPIMALRRIERSRFATVRLMRRFFAAGARGAVRTMFFILLFYSLAIWLIVSFSMVEDEHLTKTIMYIPPTAFFYLAMPAILLAMRKKLRSNPGAIRIVVFIWWLVAGAVLITLLGVYNPQWRPGSSYWPKLQVASAFASPPSALVAWVSSEGFLAKQNVQLISFGMGLLGLYLCWRMAGMMPRGNGGGVLPESPRAEK